MARPAATPPALRPRTVRRTPQPERPKQLSTAHLSEQNETWVFTMQYRYRGDEVDSRTNTVGRAKQQLSQPVGPALSLGPGATLEHRNLSIIDRPLSAPVSNIADASSESQIWRATPPFNRLIVFRHHRLLLGCTAGSAERQTDRQTCGRLFVLMRSSDCVKRTE